MGMIYKLKPGNTYVLFAKGVSYRITKSTYGDPGYKHAIIQEVETGLFVPHPSNDSGIEGGRWQ